MTKLYKNSSNIKLIIISSCFLTFKAFSSPLSLNKSINHKNSHLLLAIEAKQDAKSSDKPKEKQTSSEQHTPKNPQATTSQKNTSNTSSQLKSQVHDQTIDDLLLNAINKNKIPELDECATSLEPVIKMNCAKLKIKLLKSIKKKASTHLNDKEKKVLHEALDDLLMKNKIIYLKSKIPR